VISRLAFFSIAVFWAAMNFFLWRAEYGSHGSEISVPADLVWRKILTAPDPSTLSVYQNGERTGFCEFSTSVEQEMAKLDEDKPPPEGIVARAGYKIHLGGNVSFGEFTNRMKFDGSVQFSAARAWRELNLRLSTRNVAVEIHSLATNQTVHLKITSNGSSIAREFTFADLQNPNTVLRAFGGNFGGGLFGEFEMAAVPPVSALAESLHWDARRERMIVGRESVTAYRMETSALGNRIVIYVSTLGEILRVELPNNTVATLDELNKS
jgi:hypothetical protein